MSVYSYRVRLFKNDGFAVIHSVKIGAIKRQSFITFLSIVLYVSGRMLGMRV